MTFSRLHARKAVCTLCSFIKTEPCVQGTMVGRGLFAYPSAIVGDCSIWSWPEDCHMIDADVGIVGRESLVVRRVEEEEMLLHLLVERHSRLVIQVAHQDERLLPLLSLFHNNKDAQHAVFIGQTEVSASHNIMLELSHQEHSGLFATWKRNATHANWLLLAENADAVLASLKVDGRSKCAEHLGFATNLLE